MCAKDTPLGMKRVWVSHYIGLSTSQFVQYSYQISPWIDKSGASLRIETTEKKPTRILSCQIIRDWASMVFYEHAIFAIEASNFEDENLRLTSTALLPPFRDLSRLDLRYVPSAIARSIHKSNPIINSPLPQPSVSPRPNHDFRSLVYMFQSVLLPRVVLVTPLVTPYKIYILGVRVVIIFIVLEVLYVTRRRHSCASKRTVRQESTQNVHKMTCASTTQDWFSCDRNNCCAKIQTNTSLLFLL
jgi:hypothetical protein